MVTWCHHLRVPYWVRFRCPPHVCWACRRRPTPCASPPLHCDASLGGGAPAHIDWLRATEERDGMLPSCGAGPSLLPHSPAVRPSSCACAATATAAAATTTTTASITATAATLVCARYPPFYANDPISTCRKIVNYKKTLVFPADRVAHLSRACIDALHRLLCEPSRRLGSASNRRGLPPSDVVAHPWFSGVPWDSMQEVTAPFVPPVGGRIDQICRELQGVADVTSSAGKALVKELTKNFDDFPETPLPGVEGAVGGGGGGGGAAARRTPAKGKGDADHFIGFTFKRPLQTAAGAGNGDAFAALDQIDMSRV